MIHFPLIYSLLVLYLSYNKFRKVSYILLQIFLCNLGMYNKFIEANRLANPLGRLKQLKQLVKALPEYHYDTLLFLIRHLKVIADHSDKNKVSQYNYQLLYKYSVLLRYFLVLCSICSETVVQRCSEKFSKIYWKTLVLGSLFDKVITLP